MQFEFNDMDRPADGRLVSWFRPTGSTFIDGLRLCTLNMAFLLGLLLLVSLVAVILRAIGLSNWLVVLSSVVLAAIAIGVLGLLVWLRFATTYHELASARGKESRGDVMGAIAGLPFVAIGFPALVWGILSLFFSILTFSADRTGDALVRVIYGLLFLAAFAGSLIAARNQPQTGRRVDV